MVVLTRKSQTVISIHVLVQKLTWHAIQNNCLVQQVIFELLAASTYSDAFTQRQIHFEALLHPRLCPSSFVQYSCCFSQNHCILIFGGWCRDKGVIKEVSAIGHYSVTKEQRFIQHLINIGMWLAWNEVEQMGLVCDGQKVGLECVDKQSTLCLRMRNSICNSSQTANKSSYRIYYLSW